MNYLAHIYLSYDFDDILVGNFAADFISNKQVKKLSEEQINGVLLHRLIDAYTDIHPSVRKVTKILRPIQGKYAPVVSDIIFDYILAKNWSDFHSTELADFKTSVYQRLVAKVLEFPPKAQTKVLGLSNGDFISSYMTLEGMDFVFRKMDERTSFPSRFIEARDQLVKNEQEISAHFYDFFPQLQSKVDAFLVGLGYEVG